jgi:hypothetical protein
VESLFDLFPASVLSASTGQSGEDQAVQTAGPPASHTATNMEQSTGNQNRENIRRVNLTCNYCTWLSCAKMAVWGILILVCRSYGLKNLAEEIVILLN